MKRSSLDLFSAISPQSLSFFRVAFGIILIWDSIKHFQQNLIHRYYINPDYNFKYDWFTWLEPLPNAGLYLAFAGIGVAALLVSLGLFYRVAISYLFLATTYFFLLEETRYLNHTYLIILLSFLMIFLPLNQHFSLDALRKKQTPKNKPTMPRWALLLLQFQIAVPYFFGGIAKLQSDWYQGQPMKLWLGARTDFPIIGSLFTKDWVALLMSYSGLTLDLLAAPLLLWKPTRPYIFIVLTTFHYLNSNWFTIDIFPWLMLCGTTLFLEPNWPTKLLNNIRSASKPKQIIYALSALSMGTLALRMHENLNPVVFSVGTITGLIIIYLISNQTTPKNIQQATPKQTLRNKKTKRNTQRSKQARVIILLSIWIGLQSLLPLRHFIIPGYSIWTEEGHRFAWHMLLRTKNSSISYLIDDKNTGQRTEINPKDQLESWQYIRLEDAPHLIHEYAKYLVKDKNPQDISVRVQAQTSLNGRNPQPLIDSSINLNNEPLGKQHVNWIFPLREPLK